ncbi:MAG: UDP-glucose:(heptosyl)LPS alpha,3-glucosyltransferase [Desulfonauticus sp.]|nr:UDP-glucose:(heptosyl)LPS alpha,3-glucosyltransferase [Desulfonauticus sp.]
MKKNKEIFLYLPRFSLYGGVERFAFNLAIYLLQQNFSVTFVCSRAEIKPPAGLKVITLGRPPLNKASKMLYFALKARNIKRQFPKALHFSLGKTLEQDILRIGGGPLKIFWQLSKEAYPGLHKHFKMLRRRLAPSNWLTFLLEQKQLSQSKEIICVSSLVKEWLLTAYPHLNPERITVIYNLPDLKKFKVQPQKEAFRKEFKLPFNKKLVLTVATNFQLKGLAFLIKALKYLPADFALVVAGGRNPRKYLYLAKKHSLESRSNALLEAMACGLKALSSRFNGSAIFLPDQQIIHNPKDCREIAQKLLSAQTLPLNYPKNLEVGFPAYLRVIEKYL